MQTSPSDTRATWREKLGWTLLLVAVSAFGFLYIDMHNANVANAAQALPLETRLDDFIPFVPIFVLAYFLYYPWLLLPLLVLREREAYFRALAAFAIMQLCAGVTFVMFPSHMIRPTVIPAGFAGDLVRFMYRMDMGWNVFPSLHVGHSVLVALLFYKHNRKHFPLVALGSALISASTVLIKQHYVVDIPAGMVLAWVCYRLAYLPLPAAGQEERALVGGSWRTELWIRHLASRRPGNKRDSVR